MIPDERKEELRMVSICIARLDGVVRFRTDFLSLPHQKNGFMADAGDFGAGHSASRRVHLEKHALSIAFHLPSNLT